MILRCTNVSPAHLISAILACYVTPTSPHVNCRLLITEFLCDVQNLGNTKCFIRYFYHPSFSEIVRQRYAIFAEDFCSKLDG